MPWLSPTAAAQRLGVSTHTVRRRSQLPEAHPAHVRADGAGRGKGFRARYWFDDAKGDPDTLPAAPAPLEVKHDTGGSAYWFDDARDVYVFSLRSRAGKPFPVPGETARAVVKAYSNDGSAATLNEIARTHGWPRATVREVLKALGKTHDSLPFSDEELAARDEGALVEDAVRLKEQSVYLKAERKSWDATKRLADEARRFDHFVGKRIADVLATTPLTPPTPSPKLHVRLAPAADPFSVVVGLTDLHFGAAGWRDEVGQEINREIVRERALSTTDRLIERVLRFGRPTRALLPVGSDNIHADTDLGTTTKGTPLDTDGSFARMFVGACSLYEELIARLLAVVPEVVLDAVPGNHDRLSTMMLAHWLSARYRDDARVRVGSCVAHRSYHLFGRSMVGITHGDGLKDEKLPLVMAAEAPAAWGASDHRTIFTGHLHTDRSNEFAGVRVIHMPCLATADRWHHRNAYVGNTKAISAYLIDDAEGLVATLPVQPPARGAA